MKRKHFHVSFYILVPAIFSGITVLTVIVAFRISAYYQKIGIIPDKEMAWLALAAASLSFLCGFLIMRFILKPILRFVKTTKTLPVMAKMPAKGNEPADTQNVEELHRFFDEVTTLLSKVEAKEQFPGIIGQSRPMRAVFSQIMKVAPTDTTVLLSGESGTGKELIATAIYEHSLRNGKPFIKVNCVAIPEGLLESELFGHEKGAFTGATARKKGKFELADGGAIFLDEIGDMPPATQAKLLRVLQEREFERVGGNQSIRVDVRFIAATNKDLMQMVRAGSFREDLFYRLNVFNIHLPPLRDRREDILFLTEHFLEKAEKRIELSSKAMELLLSAPWPGNIRELQNVIERAAVMAEEGTIEPGHLSANILGASLRSPAEGTTDNTPLDDRLAEIERGMIMEALTRAGGIQARAAEILGINQRSLWHRIKKFNIDVSTFKNP